jgi:short-subunit dehydrogenase
MQRPINEQVVVITGASSGIGRETALMFGQRGATVVLAARNEPALTEAAREIERLGGRATVVATDVAEWSQVEKLAQEAVGQFGRIDTWVNNAGVSEYATVDEMTIEEIDRIINVDLLGMIYGVKAALPILKAQDRGTIINVASGLSDRAVPLQSVYCAAKHGIKGFSEALRIELEHAGSNLNVTLIQPSSINTPFFNHARSKIGVQPQPIPPVYEPRAVAEAILYASEHPIRNVHVGAAGKMLSVMQRISPSLVDRYMLIGGQAFKSQKTDRPDDRRDNMFTPSTGTGSSTGEFGKLSQSTSIYTRLLGLHPNRGRAAAAAGGLAGAFALSRRGR